MVFWPKLSLLVWIESYKKFFEFGPLSTKVRENLTHLVAVGESAYFYSAPSPTVLFFIARFLL
jgi:hypothetical protein